MASVGHISDIKDTKASYKNTGIYPDQDFKVNRVLLENKKEIVNNLKVQANLADFVFVFTDVDREGALIAKSLVTFLKLKLTKCFRIVTHEITPKAVVYAIEHPIEFKTDLVEAAEARQIVDKLIGYSLTPIVKTYLGCKSAGRCQSLGLKLICDREKEIQNFIPETYYNLYLNFNINDTTYKAKYVGTDKDVIDHLQTKEEAKAIQIQCDKDFVLTEVNQKIKYESPKPPFCTATLQQECANKFNLKVKDTMSIAQKLFERGFITYLRTDSTEMSAEFKNELATYINTNYNTSYNNPRTAKKAVSEQDGHECIRITDITLTPEKAVERIKNNLQAKVYKLIWQRTIASALPNAEASEINYIIYNGKHKFILTTTCLTNLGYRIIYSEKDTCKQPEVILQKDSIIKDSNFEILSSTTTPPARYTEASLVKQLQDLGIGRPSTFSAIIESILSMDRGYAVLEDKKIVPTSKGVQLSAYLDRAFSDIINLNYSKDLEDNLDKIAQGEYNKLDFLNSFFKKLDTLVKDSKREDLLVDNTVKICPKCGATLIIKRNKRGKIFYACPNYPQCKYTENY